MGEPGPDPAPVPPRERPYGLDDLVAHEKRNLRLILVVFVLAMAWYAVRGRTAPIADPSTTAPVESASSPR